LEPAAAPLSFPTGKKLEYVDVNADAFYDISQKDASSLL